MMWFEGSISEAVATSKARNAVFVVYVEGSDEASITTAEAINNAEVSSKLESNDFVAIKLNSSSESYRLFAQIYQVVPVPSLFFIGRDGRPLEIVAGASTSADIVNRIETVLAKVNGPASSVVVQPPIPSPAQTVTSSADPPHSVGSSTVPHSSQENASNSVDLEPSTSEPVVKKETEAEAISRMEKAKELIEKTRLKKLEEEKAKEREKEMERRKVGQEVQRLRQWQQDQELKQLKEEREKEKREEAAARERVRQQIAQDKLERAKRNSQAQEKKEGEKEPQIVLPRAVSTSDSARLQLRLPDGSSITYQMSSTAPLSDLRAYVSSRLNQSPGNFIMSTTFPRRVLTPEEDFQTMKDLELVPTAVILILPTGGVIQPAVSSALSPITRVFWVLITPIISTLTFVRNLLFGRGVNNATDSVASDAASRRRLSPEPAPPQGGPARRVPSSSEVRREGNSNVHRLAQPRDSSDEDNNTWNGNSTQQM